MTSGPRSARIYPRKSKVTGRPPDSTVLPKRCSSLPRSSPCGPPKCHPEISICCADRDFQTRRFMTPCRSSLTSTTSTGSPMLSA